MSASKYLPPYTTEERVAMTGGRVSSGPALRMPVDPAEDVAEAEVTYADFLGDEVRD